MALAFSACVLSFREAPILDLSLAQKVVVCGIIRSWRHLLDLRRNKPPCSLFSYIFPFSSSFFALIANVNISTAQPMALAKITHTLSLRVQWEQIVCVVCLLSLLIFVCAANLPIASSRRTFSPLWDWLYFFICFLAAAAAAATK